MTPPLSQGNAFLRKNGPLLGAVAIGCGGAYYYWYQKSKKEKGTLKVPSKMPEATLTAKDTVTEVKKAIEKVAAGTEQK